MKSPRGVIRRVLALAGATALASAIAVFIPSAAQAHHPIVTGDATCDAESGQWKVTWTVKNSEWDIDGAITKVSLTPLGTTVTNIAAGAVLPLNKKPPLTGVQLVPGTATSAKLTVSVVWYRGSSVIKSTKYGAVNFSGTCVVPESKPAATFASHCDGTVTASLINTEEATAPAKFDVTGASGFSKSITVAPHDSADVDVPEASAGSITVKVGTKLIAAAAFKDPEGCATPTTEVTTACDSLSVLVTNPADGRNVTVLLTPAAAGTQAAPDPVTFLLKPGESKSTSFQSSAVATVALKVTGLPDATTNWIQPASCVVRTAPTPTPTPAAPELPTTGSSLTVPITAGAVLVVMGGAILFVVRRRRGAHARF